MIDELDANSKGNALNEIQDIFVAIDVDLEEFLHFDDQLEKRRIQDLAMSMVENQNEDDENYKEPKNLKKNYKTAISTTSRNYKHFL